MHQRGTRKHFIKPPLVYLASGKPLRSNVVADSTSCFDRLAGKSLTLCYIASVAGLHNSAGLITLSPLEGSLRRAFGEKRSFIVCKKKTKRNTQTDDLLNLLIVTFNH